MTSTITRIAPEAPMPVGAAHAAAWEDDQPMPSRPFFGVPRGIAGRTIVVGASGHQWADGSIESVASIEIVGHLHGLNSDQARELASILLQAADEVDGWVAR
ncbi:hypothetical protein [Mycolicibacterium hodleri]|uniref:Uncharacterized protein n=1 Tax=Mycolicibacterium hodleri TaxID=49897 RepID=A0A502EKU6_9MYCO|nr:hypothetical protein [Mycolicibacterium hodleri]TPG37150.1 hypothetical protein EAH80_04735 [Mycolicibacterium hodleri]